MWQGDISDPVHPEVLRQLASEYKPGTTTADKNANNFVPPSTCNETHKQKCQHQRTRRPPYIAPPPTPRVPALYRHRRVCITETRA